MEGDGVVDGDAARADDLLDAEVCGGGGGWSLFLVGNLCGQAEVEGAAASGGMGEERGANGVADRSLLLF